MVKIKALVVFDLSSAVMVEDYQAAIENILDGHGELYSFSPLKE